MGCQIVPVPCNPCLLTGQLFAYDCPIQSTTCYIYPWDSNPLITSFGGVLGSTLQSYLDANGLTFGSCDITTLQTTWYVNAKLDGVDIVTYPFFNGVGYNNVLSVPTDTQWLNGIQSGFVDLQSYGLNYYIDNNYTITIYNNNCIPLSVTQNFELNVGINFNLLCS